MAIKAVTFDAYGTLLKADELLLIPRRIVEDHGLRAPVDEVLRAWIELYTEAIQRTPFRTLREIESQILAEVLRRFEVDADATPYVDLFFEVTTKVDLYPGTLDVLKALGPRRAAVVSNADHEHVAAWRFELPVDFVLISEAVRAYKPHPDVFRRALARLELEPHEVLHVGDSDVDDVMGAKAVGLRVAWINRGGRPRRPGVPEPDHEIRDLSEVLTLL